MQYSRIKSDLTACESLDMLPSVPGPQAGLDIYYYILTWDKLKKVYEKIKEFVNDLQKNSPSIPKKFVTEFRLWKKRMDHLLKEFDTDVRNEYEHPSLEPYIKGNIFIWGIILIDDSGDIKAHMGKTCVATIKNEHCVRIQNLRTDLVDLFLNHFSQKPLTEELVKSRNSIEENIDSIVNQLRDLISRNDIAEFEKQLHVLLMLDIHLMQEGVPLSPSVKDKIHSIIGGGKASNSK